MAEEAEVVPPGVPKRLDEVLADARPTLQRLAARLCHNSDDARDLVQDTFERACRRSIPPQVRSTRAWLATIMQHLFIDRCRVAERRPIPEVLQDAHGTIALFEPDAPEPPWTRITVEDIHEALEQIEPVYREVYRLRMFENLSYEDIARRCSVERPTVGTRLSRARKRLRDVLVKRFGMEESP